MKTLTHQQAQAMIHTGQAGPEFDREALASHLAACADCRAYAALVEELSAVVPSLYPPAAFSEREIRQKAAAKRALVRRQIHMTRISQGARSFVFVGAALALLLALVILSPRLLPNQPGTMEEQTPPPAVSPAAETQAVPTSSPEVYDPAAPKAHTVVEGENLLSIAEKYHLQPQTILWSNESLLHDNPYNIRPGMTLRIPLFDGLYYRWQSGDTWEAVAERFGANVDMMRGWLENLSNIGGAESADVPPGTEIFIPGGTMPLQSWPAPAIDEANSQRILSPDGQLAAVYQPGPGLLRIDDAQTGETLVSGFMGAVGPGNWSPDSRYLLYWENRMGSASLQADGLPLWALDTRTGETKLIGTTLVNVYYLSWSPDGRQLAFTRGGGRSAQVEKWLSVFNAYTGQVRDLIPKERLVPGALAWSPDGKWIAAAAVDGSLTGPEYADSMGWDNPAVAARRIYLVDPASGEYRRLTQSAAYEDAPRWSADGKRLFFVQAQGTQARLMSADPETGDIEVLGCEVAMPPATDYYGQTDWGGIYSSCASVLEPPAPTPTPTAEFELYFYRPLVVDYDPAVWSDSSEPDNREMMVNYLQHKELESCTIGVRGPSGFYPENMADVTLGNITYQMYEQEIEGGKIVKDYFFKSSTTDGFDDVTSTIGIPILQVQSSPEEKQGCQTAAEEVFAALHPSERLINMPFCEKLARDYRTPPNYTTYCDAQYNFAFDYPEDWVIEPLSETPDSASPHVVRSVKRFQKQDMSNYIRVDTYALPETSTLEDRVKANSFYAEREFPDHEYADLRIGGQPAYAIVRRWHQDYSAVYLFFQHGAYYTNMEIKAISAPKLDTNWKIARSIQIPGATVDDNFIPDELLIDSYSLVR